MTIHGDIICLAGASVVAVIGAALDVRKSHQIPNWLTVPAAALGLATQWTCNGWRSAAMAAGAVVLVLAVMGVFYMKETIGGGDVKLLAAVAAFVSIPHTFQVMFYAAILGAVIALACAAWKRILWASLNNTKLIILNVVTLGMVERPHLSLNQDDAHTMPYGPAIAAGTIATLILTWGIR